MNKLTVELGIDRHNLEGLHDLWTAWVKEEGRELNDEIWSIYMTSLVGSGTYVPLVVWDGDKPVGMVDMLFSICPFYGKTQTNGDHLYVLPEYRKQGVFNLMARNLEAASKFLGADLEFVPVGQSNIGWLDGYYERRGFKPAGVVLRRGEL